VTVHGCRPRAGVTILIRCCYSMIRKSGYRFSEKIMLQAKISDHDPIPFNRTMV